eukprot:403335724
MHILLFQFLTQTKRKASLEVSLKECSDLRLELSSSNQLYEALKKSFDALEAQTQADALSFEKKVQESTRMLEAQKTMMLELQLQKAEEKKEKESAKQALEKANLQNCILKDTIKRNESQARSDDNFLRSKIVKLEDQIRLLQADLAKKQKLSDTAVPVLNSTALSEALEENHCQESNSHDAQPEASHQQQPQGSKLLHTQESRKLEVTAKDSAPLRERDMNRQNLQHLNSAATFISSMLCQFNLKALQLYREIWGDVFQCFSNLEIASKQFGGKLKCFWKQRIWWLLHLWAGQQHATEDVRQFFSKQFRQAY